MFYIDFTSPDGKTYRIDLTGKPITYHCRVCGYEKLYMLNDSDPTDCCDTCEERRREEEDRESKKRFWQKTIAQINRFCNSDIDMCTIDQWALEATEKNLSPEDEISFFKEKINLLRSS